MNETLQLKSGHTATLALASFTEASELRRVLAREIAAAPLEIGGDLAAIMGKDVGVLKNLICQLLASEALEKQIFKCLARCLLDGQKITPQTFEPAEMRGDYLPLAVEVVKMNILPFFEGLELASLIPSKGPSEDRK
jgi:hypothetical protein